MALQTNQKSYFREPVLGGIFNCNGKYVAPQKNYMCRKYKKRQPVKKKQLYPCYFEGCSKPSTYGYINDMKKISCLSHKKKDMRSLKGHFCYCKKRASYNYEGLHAKYCKKHSLDGMIIVKVQRCNYEGCKKIPSFYLPDDSGIKKCTRCAEHKLDGMISKKTTPS
jgi:hypothetical protein